MSSSNFCRNCGARLLRKGWRVWLRGPLCDDCARRPGVSNRQSTLIGIAFVAVAAFAFGRYRSPAPPPLVIQRAANSPLSDTPLNLNGTERGDGNPNAIATSSSSAEDDTIYICGARTKKGAPCRRRVQIAGKRCFQHKGRSAMVSLEKLVISPDSSKK